MPIGTSEQIEKFQEFIDINYKSKLHELVKKGKKSMQINFSELAKFDHELADILLSSPEDTLKAVEIATSHIDLPEDVSIKVRFFNLPASQKLMIKNIRSEHIDRFVVVEGIVRQASDVRPQVVSAKFECPSCGNTITILQVDTKFKDPSRCSCGRRGKFRLLGKELVDAQRLLIEESPEMLEGGDQPKRISVFLKEDLVEPKLEKKTTPGSKIRVNGIIKEVPIILRSGGMSIRYDLMVDANFIEPIEAIFDDIELDKEDIEKIKKLAKDVGIYDKLGRSIAPSIYGHDDIKSALVLQLMGGVKKERSDGTTSRGDIHILLVGDPGAAKSTLLTYMSKAAPKARYISGKGASGAGLTASVVKDEFLRGWALEAGALVLANGGFCMIDELDKMSPDDRSAMHEALAQQKVSISKANIQATLRAETTVLAAANPKLGRFDPYTPIPAQIDLPPTLINRFDLIFPVRDLPNREIDTLIAGHVLEMHRNVKGKEPEIDMDLLKKYVAYVKQNIFPKLGDDAIDEIKKFYVNLRVSGSTEDNIIKTIPISARQLEALIRLSEASARVRLSKKITRSDARRAINSLKHCLLQVGLDPETGQIDIDRISTGITASTRNRMIIIREIISNFDSMGRKSIPLEEIMAEASERGIGGEMVEEVIEKLKKEGIIFEPKRGFISKL